MRRAVLIIVAAATGLTSCASTEVGTGSATTPATASATPTAPPRVGETQAAVAFSLYTHCGIRSTEYGGRTWVAEPPRPEPRVRADVTGIVTHDGYTEGTITVVDDDLLRFVVTDPLVEEVGLAVDFVPAAVPVPACE